MTTDQTIPTSPPLSPLDREKLAFYLGARLEPHYLTREDIDPAALESWARSPAIAPHIQGFRYINSLATQQIHTANYFDAQKAVSDEFKNATTSTERLRAISAYIRLSNSRAATLRAKKSSAKSSAKPDEGPATTGSPRPIATTAARRREIERERLESLGLLPALPALPRIVAPQPVTHSPNPGAPAPGSSHPTTTAPIITIAPTPAHVTGAHADDEPASRRATVATVTSTLSTPTPVTPAPASSRTTATAPKGTADRAAADRSAESPSHPHTSEVPLPTSTPARAHLARLVTRAGSATEEQGADIGAWP